MARTSPNHCWSSTETCTSSEEIWQATTTWPHPWHTYLSVCWRAIRELNVFTVWTVTDANLTTIQADVASWAKPSLAPVRGCEWRTSSTQCFTWDLRPPSRLPRCLHRCAATRRISERGWHLLESSPLASFRIRVSFVRPEAWSEAPEANSVSS